MVQKLIYYEKAIQLRRKGYSYNEILKEVPVAKSTLALWLHSVGLSRYIKQILSDKKRRGILKGGQARHNQRVALTKSIFEKCKKELGPLSHRDLLLMGIMLYWAEGSKEKEARPGSGIRFTNSDARMIRLFLVWLLKVVTVPKEKIHFSIYIHTNQSGRITDHCRYWSKQCGFALSSFNKVYYKVHQPKTNRINIGDNYHGVLNIMVRSSSELLRRTAGWVEAIGQYYWGMV